MKHFLSLLSKTFVFFLIENDSEYLTRNLQGSVMKKDLCTYLFEYSPDVPKRKTRVLDIFNTDKSI